VNSQITPPVGTTVTLIIQPLKSASPKGEKK